MAAEVTVVLRFGTNSVSGRGDYTLTTAINQTASANVDIPLRALVEEQVDYLADAAILNDVSAELFLGLVETVRIDGERASLELRNGQEMTDMRLGGGGFAGISVQEMVWSLARGAGIPEKRIVIQGWVPGPDELFEVVTPLTGIVADRRMDIGGVLISGEQRIAASVAGLGPDAVRSVFEDAASWALVSVRARTVVEAQAAGIEAIDLAVNWVTARSHYGGASLPGGEAIAFDRQNSFSRVARGGAVYIRGLTTGRRLLRSPNDFIPVKDLSPAAVDLFDVPRLASDGLTAQEREAIAAWRRSIEAADPMARASAISESIEFLTGGLKSGAVKLFDKTARRALRECAAEHLNGEQQGRFKDLLGWLNEPSLAAKLDLWLEREGIDLSPSDRQVLDRVRQVRNDFVHGRSRAVPSAGDLRYASSVVNRMLVRRVHNLTAAGG